MLSDAKNGERRQDTFESCTDQLKYDTIVVFIYIYNELKNKKD